LTGPQSRLFKALPWLAAGAPVNAVVWRQDQGRHAGQVATHADATAAASRIRQTGKAEAALVDTLVNAARIEKGQARRHRFWAARLVAALAKDHAEVREAVRTLASAVEWQVRYRAMRRLDTDSPRRSCAEGCATTTRSYDTWPPAPPVRCS